MIPDVIDWREQAALTEEQLLDFEEYIWPVFKALGFSRDLALLAHLLILLQQA